MTSPRITVIIATYNWSSVLPYAIRSVLAQTVRDFELLVVGDGCTDDSEQVVRQFTDPRVRWINLASHHGHQSAPNNRGLEEAKGEFIAYLGHDDLWLPHHLEALVASLRSTGAAMAYSMVSRIAPAAAVGSPVLALPKSGRWAAPSGTIHRRLVTDKVGGWRDHRELYDPPEVDLWRRAEAAGFEFVFVPRLSVLKFPASKRKDVYIERPCHEQAAWLRRIETEPDSEATHLVHMIVSGEVVRATPARRLLPITAQALASRLLWRLSPRSGLRWLFFPAKGAGIAQVQKYKGL